MEIPTVGALAADVAVPAGEGTWPGVVVVHDAFGMSTDLRRQADWLAASGYLAAAPDLYHGGNKLGCIRTVMRDALSRRGRAFDDLEATRVWPADRPDCTGRIGVIGFCRGAGSPSCWLPGGDSPRRVSTTAEYRRTPRTSCGVPAR